MSSEGANETRGSCLAVLLLGQDLGYYTTMNIRLIQVVASSHPFVLVGLMILGVVPQAASRKALGVEFARVSHSIQLHIQADVRLDESKKGVRQTLHDKKIWPRYG